MPIVAGDPDATRIATATYLPDCSLTAPTVTVVPARVYPNDYSVDCEGCVYAVSANQLAITAPPRSSPRRSRFVSNFGWFFLPDAYWLASVRVE